ncbi:MAG: branched-chain amino acid ABC transporter permease [Desulfobacterales bacterium]|nr:MAG: branched-chain amino acid ABC transporter permease [Desulfobacterales bacterium]
MSATLFFDLLLGGLILGGLYALIAVGLGLQYGVARVLNVSHGEFIMLGAFGTYSLHTLAGLNPILSLVISGPLIFLIAFGLHRTLFRYLRKTSPTQTAFEGNSLLASFGLLFVIQNIALLTWGPDIKGYSYLTATLDIGGALYAANRLLALVLALGLALVFYLFLARTRTGKAIRAAAQDLSVAQLMGINIHTVLGLCFGLGALMAALAGALVSMMFEITPLMGLPYTVIAVIAVVLGGLGNIMGSVVGGLILGVVGNLVTYIHPGLSMIAYYVIFLLLLLVKPRGILGR